MPSINWHHGPVDTSAVAHLRCRSSMPSWKYLSARWLPSPPVLFASGGREMALKEDVPTGEGGRGGGVKKAQAVVVWEGEMVRAHGFLGPVFWWRGRG